MKMFGGCHKGFTMLELIIATSLVAIMFIASSSLTIMAVRQSQLAHKTNFEETKSLRAVNEIYSSILSATQDNGGIGVGENTLTLSIPSPNSTDGTSGSITFSFAENSDNSHYTMVIQRVSAAGEIFEYPISSSVIPLFENGEFFKVNDSGGIDFGWLLHVLTKDEEILYSIPFFGSEFPNAQL